MDNKPENRFDGKMDTPKKAFIYASKPPKLCRKTCWITTKSTFKIKIYDFKFAENINKRKMA